jgi:hypothetical protein
MFKDTWTSFASGEHRRSGHGYSAIHVVDRWVVDFSRVHRLDIAEG